MNDATDAALATPATVSTGRASGLGLEPLMSILELSTYLDVPVATIYDWRVDGKGPRALRVGRHLRFAVSDVEAWLATLREPQPGGPQPTRW